MLQLVYISSARNPGSADIGSILSTSRRNNKANGITGLLYVDGRRFLQALEGPEDAVEVTYARIERDERHRGIVLLSRRTIEDREFGEWEMAERRPGIDGEAFLSRIDMLLHRASPNVRATFAGLARMNRAA